MNRIELHERAVDPLRTGFPNIDALPRMAGDDSIPGSLDLGNEHALLFALPSLLRASQRHSAIFSVQWPIALNPDEREDPSAMFRVSLHACAGELAARKNHEVLRPPVSAAFCTRGASGDHLVAGMPELLQKGKIEVGVGRVHEC